MTLVSLTMQVPSLQVAASIDVGSPLYLPKDRHLLIMKYIQLLIILCKKDKSFIRYIKVGVLNSVLTFILSVILFYIFHADKNLSYTLSVVYGIFQSMALNISYTFSAKYSLSTVFAFITSALAALLVGNAVVFIASLIGFSYYIQQMLGMLCYSLILYIVLSCLIKSGN